jgi:uncharacterized membrane protein
MAAAGLLTAGGLAVLGRWAYAPIVGWDVGAFVFELWVWLAVARMDAAATRVHAAREDPSPRASDILLLIANLASLGAVAFVVVDSTNAHGTARVFLAALALFSVGVSWLLVQTLFTLRYAVFYYSGTAGGIDFNSDEPPRYADFAYVAFTLGMTYQVSDTDIENSRIRGAMTRHGLLSYLFGSVIVATTINLVVGLSNS